ncbi:outer membrane beta-barrel protein [Flavobacterium sp.]|uniref:outer membrane beta-barrel protein n=1 Tax=Flavobacterium sp. TaxID=239 RepID=UPI0037ACD18F
MKKIILSAIMLIGLAFTTQAQDVSNNALGLRLGDNSGFGGEISYQKGLSKNNRLELDLGWRDRTNYNVNGYNDNAIKLAGLYQWVWNIDGDFNWYAGVGGGLGSYSSKYNGIDKSGAFVFVAGDIGIEYAFREIPLLISLDLRPEIGGSGYYSNSYGSDIALGLRYKF